MKRWTAGLAALVVLVAFGHVEASIATFDDISTDASGTIPDGYAGFDWNQFGYVDAIRYGLPLSGYANGTVSPDYVAYNQWANVATVNDGLFDFEGAYLTAAWRDGLNIEVRGYLGGSQTYIQTVVVNHDAPTWFQFDFLGIDEVEFYSWGGTETPNLGGSGEHFAMDNFTTKIIPEPCTLVIWLLLGVLGISVGWWRRRRAA